MQHISHITRITQEQILNVKESLKARRSVIDFETLGRTLAYSPYVPRVGREFFIRDKDSKPKCAMNMPLISLNGHIQSLDMLYQAASLESKEVHLESNIFSKDAAMNASINCLNESADSIAPHCYVLDTSIVYTDMYMDKSSDDGNPNAQDSMLCLESVALLRRHSALPIIHSDIFLECYQILESALYGADALLMPMRFIEDKSLKELLHFAHRLGLAVFVAISDKNELKRAIFCGANMLFVPQDAYNELLGLIPNTQVIATSHTDDASDYGVDMWIL